MAATPPNELEAALLAGAVRDARLAQRDACRAPQQARNALRALPFGADADQRRQADERYQRALEAERDARAALEQARLAQRSYWRRAVRRPARRSPARRG